MQSKMTPLLGDSLQEAIKREGYAFARADDMRGALDHAGSLSDWDQFTASWDNLRLDTYLADRGRYRQRRYAVYAISAGGEISRETHQPHYQSRDHNVLYGGIDRWFDPVLPEIGRGPSMQTILGFCLKVFGGLAQDMPAWHVEVHQFRIEARPGKDGHPTPEGMHRDGVDYALVLLIRRQNIISGTTIISSRDKSPRQSFTLTDPFDAAFVDDNQVLHGVTAVEPLGKAAVGFRDVLVVTFRRDKKEPS